MENKILIIGNLKNNQKRWTSQEKSGFGNLQCNWKVGNIILNKNAIGLSTDGFF